jgi:hypothetical protein
MNFLRPRSSIARGAAVCCLVLAVAPLHLANAQGTSPPVKQSAPATTTFSLDLLKGTWVRPDGGYTITIKSVAPDGQLEAMYANPRPLPFSKATASLDGKTIRAFFELQAGGYNGSTYELTYDAATDRLKGTYYQAVVKQKFDVVFERK